MTRVRRRLGPSVRGPQLGPLEDELVDPRPERYRNKLARLFADRARSTHRPPERRMGDLLRARDIEADHYRRHPEQYEEPS